MLQANIKLTRSNQETYYKQRLNLTRYKFTSHTMPPKQDPIRFMQHVLVDLRYKTAYILNNLIKCNFCNFTLLMPPTLDALGRHLVRPPPLCTPLASCDALALFTTLMHSSIKDSTSIFDGSHGRCGESDQLYLRGKKALALPTFGQKNGSATGRTFALYQSPLAVERQMPLSVV